MIASAGGMNAGWFRMFLEAAYAIARITLATLSMISPIWSSLTIKGGVSASVSPATRSIRSLSWKALLSPAKPRLPGASATRREVDAGGQADGADIHHVRLLRSDITASANFGSSLLARSNSFSSR